MANTERELEALKREKAKLEKTVDALKGKRLDEAKKTDALEGFSGKYKHLASGEIFALKVVEPHEARYGRTHFTKNETMSGDYTPAEFRAQFEKL